MLQSPHKLLLEGRTGEKNKRWLQKRDPLPFAATIYIPSPDSDIYLHHLIRGRVKKERARERQDEQERCWHMKEWRTDLGSMLKVDYGHYTFLPMIAVPSSQGC